MYRNQFDIFKLCTVSEGAGEDLVWWANLNKSSCTMSLLEPQAQTVLESDAPRTGWGVIHEGVPSSARRSVPDVSKKECISPLMPQNTR